MKVTFCESQLASGADEEACLTFNDEMRVHGEASPQIETFPLTLFDIIIVIYNIPLLFCAQQ